MGSHADASSDGRAAAIDRGYRDLAENSPDIISRFDRGLRHVYVNRAIVRATGVPAERWIGRTHAEMGVPAELAAHWGAVLRRAFTDGEERTIDFAFPTPEGVRCYEARIVPEAGADGRPVTLLCVSRDVTEARHAVRELEEREAEEASLRRAATEVAREREPHRIFDAVSREAALLVGADTGYVIQLEGGGGRLAGAHHGGEVSPPTPAAIADMLDGETASGRALRAGRPARMDDYQATDDRAARLVAELGHASAVAAPVWHRGEPWGVVVAVSDRADALGPASERRIASLAGLAELAVANAEARAELVQQALTDHLTGLANRRAFTERLAEEVARAERHGHTLALALFDIDGFKQVNDRFGHATGDRVLEEVARRLAEGSRRGEMVARTGGEEFAWILPGSDILGAWRAAERARRRVGGKEVAEAGIVTVSAGIAAQEGRRSAAELLVAADRALYAAKAGGRNRSVSEPRPDY